MKGDEKKEKETEIQKTERRGKKQKEGKNATS